MKFHRDEELFIKCHIFILKIQYLHNFIQPIADRIFVEIHFLCRLGKISIIVNKTYSGLHQVLFVFFIIFQYRQDNFVVKLQ
jgi:hypothetical protein